MPAKGSQSTLEVSPLPEPLGVDRSTYLLGACRARPMLGVVEPQTALIKRQSQVVQQAAHFGVEVLDQTFNSLSVAESFFQDDVINLGTGLGSAIDVTFGYNLVADGAGGFGFDLAVGGAVPEPSTWAMMLLGLAGLGYAGYRRKKRGRAPWF